MIRRRLGKSKVRPLTRRAMAGCARAVAALVCTGMLVVLGIVAASALFNLCAYLGAARHRRRHPPACAADEKERAPGPARAGAFAVMSLLFSRRVYALVREDLAVERAAAAATAEGGRAWRI